MDGGVVEPEQDQPDDRPGDSRDQEHPPRPEDAAHIMGKLLVHLGEDNIIWGTDAIWYGPTQPALDASWAFQIPDRMCEEFGYPKITPEIIQPITQEMIKDGLARKRDRICFRWRRVAPRRLPPSPQMQQQNERRWQESRRAWSRGTGRKAGCGPSPPARCRARRSRSPGRHRPPE